MGLSFAGSQAAPLPWLPVFSVWRPSAPSGLALAAHFHTNMGVALNGPSFLTHINMHARTVTHIQHTAAETGPAWLRSLYSLLFTTLPPPATHITEHCCSHSSVIALRSTLFVFYCSHAFILDAISDFANYQGADACVVGSSRIKHSLSFNMNSFSLMLHSWVYPVFVSLRGRTVNSLLNKARPGQVVLRLG